MLVNINIQLWKLLGQIFLKLLITQSVTFFMFCILIGFILEALIGQVDLVIFG